MNKAHLRFCPLDLKNVFHLHIEVQVLCDILFPVEGNNVWNQIDHSEVMAILLQEL